MSTTYQAPDTGIEVTCGDNVDTVQFLVPGTDWWVTNAGMSAGVINFEAAAVPTRTQPAGAGGRYLDPGQCVRIPLCKSVTIQDASGGSSTIFAFSKGPQPLGAHT